MWIDWVLALFVGAAVLYFVVRTAVRDALLEVRRSGPLFSPPPPEPGSNE
jgi:uncharacterized membrane protein YdjX (TVP38/TMEM64 family)